jgi:glycosyltransferase involved in cell wall biosynthesis
MQDDGPRVSIILPTFNGGRHLMPAIQSVLDQSFRDWELIVLDDGSTDGSTAALAEFSDKRVRLLRDGKNKGLAARLNEAVGLCRGEYIARMDADDLCFPDRLERQTAFLDAHPHIDLLSSRAIVFDSETGSVIGLLPHRENHDALTATPWRSISMPHPTWMGRAAWFRRFHYRHPEVKRAEDQELLLRAYPESQYHSLPDVLLAYRQGPFAPGKTWVARKQLLAAQCLLFWQRRQMRNLLLAILITGLKAVLDVVASIPGMQRVFFQRMAQPVSPAIQQRFDALLASGDKPHAH